MCVMNTSLTWTSYALIVSVCLILYYSVVLFFYRNKFNPIFSKQSGDTNKSSHSFSDETGDNNHPKNLNLFGEEVQNEMPLITEEEQDFSPEAQDFADEISAYTSSCTKDIEKEELLRALTKIIQKYPSLAHSDARYELSQLIAVSVENYCSIHLSAEELRELWIG